MSFGSKKFGYSMNEKKAVVKKWEKRSDQYPFTLDKFLVERFGTTPDGIPNVPISTFYTWRKQILANRLRKKIKLRLC